MVAKYEGGLNSKALFFMEGSICFEARLQARQPRNCCSIPDESQVYIKRISTCCALRLCSHL